MIDAVPTKNAMKRAEPVIYFAASIRGGRDDSAIYAQLIEKLRKFGRVSTEHIGSPNLSADGEAASPRAIHDRDLDWLQSSDVIVAEVTTPSLGVGYEIAHAIQWRKPVLCLFRTGTAQSLSAMISGCPGVTVREYAKVDDTDRILAEFFSAR
jgi:2'-deoxynucleoside 5'-phosphate N-hydrolase